MATGFRVHREKTNCEPPQTFTGSGTWGREDQGPTASSIRTTASPAAGVTFVTLLVTIALFSTAFLWCKLKINPQNLITALVWSLGFFVLSLNIAYMVLTALVVLLRGPLVLSEVDCEVKAQCDLLYVIKDEPSLVFKNMESSLGTHPGQNIRLVIASNTTDSDRLEKEQREILQLQETFGTGRVLYWRPNHNPTGKKHIAVQQWMREGAAAPYCFICDADSTVPAGAIERLMRKAEHPENADIAVFQGCIRVGNCDTYFARYLRFGAELSQRVYLVACQRIFGSTPYFGHGALLRRDAFKWIRLPSSVLSHDIWDMAMLSRRGYRVVFCHDAYSYEELPSNYLESIRRDRRWVEGTMQSHRLLGLPGISFPSRFLVVFGIYSYVSQLVFLLWFMLGFAMSIGAHPSLAWGVQALSPLGAGIFVLDGGSMYLPVLLVIFLHRLPFCRSANEIGEMIKELAISTIIFLNSMVYSSIGVLLAPFGKRIWIPMRKGKGDALRLVDVLRSMIPSLFLGWVLLLVGLRYSIGWVICASPVLVSLCFGPIAVWLTSRPVGFRAAMQDSHQNTKQLGRLLATACVVIVLISSQLSYAEELILNPGFEVGSGEPRNPYGVDQWVGYGNEERSSGFIMTGSSSLKMYGGARNTGAYQVHPIIPGHRLHASCHFLTPSNDALSGTARAGIRIEFLGTDPSKSEAFVADSATPTDIWLSLQATVTQPSSIGVGRLVVVWLDGGDPSGSTYWDATSVVSIHNPNQNLVANSGFEAGEGGLSNPYGLDQWIAFGNAELSPESSYDMQASLKLFGGLSYSGAFQGFRFDPGNSLEVTVRYLTRSNDAIGGSATAGIVLEWPGPILEAVEQLDVDASDPRDQWLRRELIVYPPDGAIAARLVLPFDDGDSPSGAIYLDNVSFLSVLPGDTNADQLVNGLDIEGFVRAILDPYQVSESVRAACDLGGPNGIGMPDGSVSVEDIESFLAILIDKP